MPKKKKAKGINVNLIKIVIGALLAVVGLAASIFALPKLIGRCTKSCREMMKQGCCQPPKFIKGLFKKK